MNDALFALVTDWGAVALAVATFLSCLALPVPSSLMMLAAGAFAAAGELSLVTAGGAALAGAVAGDQTGFALGRAAGRGLDLRLRAHPARAAVLARAEAILARRGVVAVFLSRWLFSPLGPYVNLLAGGARMDWWRFTLAGIVGEAVWVALYVGLGAAFGAHLGMLADLLGNVVGLASAGAVVLVSGALLWRAARQGNARRR